MMSDDAQRLPGYIWPVLAGLVMAAFGLRIWLGLGLPLWLDESWTAMIATQPNWADFWREVWLDCNPPLYYAVMALWTGVFGASDLALRLPSLIFAALAIALPLGLRVPALSRAAALCFAVLLALWQPGFEMSVDARGYALLLALSVAQLLAYIRLMAAPDRRRAWIWAGLASLAGLTHYHSLLVSGLQGLALLYVHRARALELWPAALAFVPAFGWLAIHAPRLADYARPDVAWYEPMTPSLAGGFIRYVLGGAGWLHMGILAGVIVLSHALALGKTAAPKSGRHIAMPEARRALRWAVLASVIGLMIELALGTLRPMLTDRYLVPLVPGILLGLVLAIGQSRYYVASLAALVIAFGLTLNPSDMRAKLVEKTRYSFAPASSFIAKSPAKRLIFAWDHPAARILDAQSLAKLGGFFVARAGRDMPVTAIRLPPGRDGNALLQRTSPADAGVIWIYNRARASAARHRPPVPLLWHGRPCQLEQGRWIGTLACAPKV